MIHILEKEWKERALRFQTDLATGPLAGATWDRFPIDTDTNRKYLSDKIQIALFGNLKTPTTEQSELISYIKTKCIDKGCYNNAVHLAVIYVSVLYKHNSEYIFPIFRIRSNSEIKPEFCCMIDHLGRVYNNFSAYQEDNTWDQSLLMLPARGVYELIDGSCNVVVLDQNFRGQLKEIADSTATTIGIGSTIGMVAGLGLTLIPFTMPVGVAVVSTSGLFGATSGVYGAGRAVNTLYDRNKHELPISLYDKEARGCWISIAATSVSALSAGAGEILAPRLIRAAELGEDCSLLISGAYTTISATSLSVNAIGLCNLIYDIATKDKITNEDILNLMTTTFFFFHAAINFETASGVIKKAQSMELSKIKETLSPEQREIFDCLREAHRETVEAGKIRESDGDRNYIRELKKIENLDQFFQQFTLTSDRQLNISEELTIHQRAFVQIPEQERATILEGLKQLNQNEISLEEFQTRTANTRKDYLLTLDRERAIFKDNVARAFGGNLEDVQVGGKRIFGNVKPHEIDRLHQVTKYSLNNDPEYVQFGKDFASKMKANDVTEFCATSEYAVRQVQREINKRVTENPNPSRPRGVKAKDVYKNQIMEEFRSNHFQDLKESFEHLKTQCDVVNESMMYQFGNSYAAANHYDKHQVLPAFDSKNALTPSQYFEIANNMVSEPYCEIQWTQDGSSLKCTFKTDKVMAITFNNVSTGERVIATLMDVKKNVVVSKRFCYFPTNSIKAYYIDYWTHDL